MSLDRSDVAKIAELARLRLSDEELDTYTSQLGQILNYIDQLNELDTENVQPMPHAVDIHNVFREDAVKPSLPREEALKNAPDADDECYRVPAVL